MNKEDERQQRFAYFHQNYDQEIIASHEGLRGRWKRLVLGKPPMQNTSAQREQLKRCQELMGEWCGG